MPDVLQRAIAVGGNDTSGARDDEQTNTPLVLLTYASNRMVRAAVCAHAIQSHARHVRRSGPDAILREVLVTLRRAVAGAIRLAHRALEVHARNGGYAPAEWSRHATEHTLLVLERARNPEEHEQPHPVGAINDAAACLNRAAAATEGRWFDVPTHIADAIGLLLAVFLLACELLDA